MTIEKDAAGSRRLLPPLYLWSARAWVIMRAWFWQGLVAILVLFFIVGVVKPFETQSDPNADDIATAWNQSIDRLGISPVYPPTEDLYVGDLWAVVADATELPLLGKSVRVGHIDLRNEIKADKQRPAFADTVDLKPGEAFRHQDNREIQQASGDRIALTLAAFPGITINHTTRSLGSLGWRFAGLGASRDDEQTEEIRIPVAETYGAPTIPAFLRLDEWCNDPKTNLYCTDDFVRRILAFAIGDRLLAAREGRYLTQLQLRLVTRVFLTREIRHRRFRKDAQNAEASALTKPSVGLPFPPETAPKSVDTVATDRRGGAEPGPPSGERGPFSVKNFRTDGADIQLQEVFQRPLVFGFRALTISLAPTKPQNEGKP